jgi:SAM-dependent methyltransferase
MFNLNITHHGDRMNQEFESIIEWCKGKGVDLGCGTNPISKGHILAIDQQPDQRYASADIVHNVHDLEIEETKEFNGQVYSFVDNDLDFIFSSHCLEDFEDIPVVFANWWKKIKSGGYMVLLLPDMETCDCELCQSDDQKKYRSEKKLSARYWTIEDYDQHGVGNPSHKTNVGLKYITKLLNDLDYSYEIVQSDSIPHNASCTVDIVIKKLEVSSNG